MSHCVLWSPASLRTAGANRVFMSVTSMLPTFDMACWQCLPSIPGWLLLSSLAVARSTHNTPKASKPMKYTVVANSASADLWTNPAVSCRIHRGQNMLQHSIAWPEGWCSAAASSSNDYRSTYQSRRQLIAILCPADDILWLDSVDCISACTCTVLNNASLKSAFTMVSCQGHSTCCLTHASRLASTKTLHITWRSQMSPDGGVYDGQYTGWAFCCNSAP